MFQCCFNEYCCFYEQEKDRGHCCFKEQLKSTMSGETSITAPQHHRDHKDGPLTCDEFPTSYVVPKPSFEDDDGLVAPFPEGTLGINDVGSVGQ